MDGYTDKHDAGPQIHIGDDDELIIKQVLNESGSEKKMMKANRESKNQ